MHCYSAGCIPSTSLKTFATFSPKKVVNLTAVPCHMLASEDGMEGDRCHGERWDTGRGLLSLLEFTFWTQVGQSSLHVQTCRGVKPLQPHERGWSPEVPSLCSSGGNLLCSGARQSCVCSVELKLQIYFCCCFMSIPYKLSSRTEKFPSWKKYSVAHLDAWQP